MTLNQLKAFCAVVDQGSFRAAARSIDIAQSALTQAIQSLEWDLGVLLLVRSYSGISLTQQGKKLLVRARFIIREAEQIALDVMDSDGTGAGRVSLGASSEPLIELMMPVLDRFKRDYPRSDVNISSGSTDFLTERIRTGRLDFALCALASAFTGPGLEIERLYQSAVTVIARANHPKAETTSIGDLVGCEWVETRPEGEIGSGATPLVQIFAQQGLGDPKVALIAESTLEKLYVVSETDYLTIEPPALSQASLFSQALISLPIRETFDSHNVCLIRRSDRPVNPLALTFSSMLASYARLSRAVTVSVPH